MDEKQAVTSGEVFAVNFKIQTIQPALAWLRYTPPSLQRIGSSKSGEGS